MDEKKPGIAIMIASKMKKEPEEKEESKYAEMAQEILDAVKEEDAEGLGEALKNFIKVCTAEE